MKSSIITLFAAFSLAAPQNTSDSASNSTVKSNCPEEFPHDVGKYQYFGCLTEPNGRRALDAASLTANNMTMELCADFCGSKGYPLMGLEYSSECFCGPYPKGNAQSSEEAPCNMQCSGDPTEICGGSNHLSLFGVSDYMTPTIPAIDGYTYEGCFTEPTNGRALGKASYRDSKGLTVESCQNFCESKGFQVFGLENGDECWCGDSLADGSEDVPDSECAKTCPGDYVELACGDANRLNVYSRNVDGKM